MLITTKFTVLNTMNSFTWLSGARRYCSVLLTSNRISQNLNFWILCYLNTSRGFNLFLWPFCMVSNQRRFLIKGGLYLKRNTVVYFKSKRFWNKFYFSFQTFAHGHAMTYNGEAYPALPTHYTSYSCPAYSSQTYNTLHLPCHAPVST